MAYKINRTGDNVKALLDAVENKTIYPDASWHEHGLMSIADKIKLDNLVIHYNTTVEGETVYIPGIKIGSGNGYVQDLAFIGDEDKDILLAHIADDVRHTSAVEKARWNNKLNVNDSAEVVEESLILNRQ